MGYNFVADIMGLSSFD